MAIYYVDQTNGNDSTGTGSNVAPYKTLAKFGSVMVTGDECRLAKNATADTVITADTVWTNNSATVTVAGDVTATLGAASYVGKPTATGNGNFETFYRVTSSAYSAGTGLTTLTLTLKYIGTSETTASIVKKFYQIDTGTSSHSASSTFCYYDRGAGRSNIKISGGWNLTTEERDGETWFAGKNNNLTTSWTAFLGINQTGNTLEYINVVETYAPNTTATFVATTTHRYCTYFCGVGGGTGPFQGETHSDLVIQTTATGACFQVVSGNTSYTKFFINCQGNVWLNYTSAVITYTNCIFASTTSVKDCYSTAGRIENFINTKIYGNRASGTGCYFTGANRVFNFDSNSGIYDCVTSISCGTSGNVIKGLNTSNSTYGVSVPAQTKGIMLINFTCDRCDYPVYMADDLSKGLIVKGFTFTNIGVWGFYYLGTNDPIYLNNGYVDVTSASKLVYTPNSGAYLLPKYTISNVTNMTNGIYWYSYRFKFYDNVYRTTAPSYWFSTDSTLTTNIAYTKLYSAFVQAGTKVKLSCWIKVGGPSWVGTLNVMLSLGDTELTTTTYTTLPDVWTKYEFEMPTTATVDGVLALSFNINSNVVDFFVDDFDYAVVV